ERLGAAGAYRELGDLERVEEAEGFGLTAFYEQREGAASARAMAAVNVLLARIGDHAEVTESFDLGVLLEEGADFRRVLARAAHADLERFEAAQEHPRGVRIADAAHRVP